MGSRSVRLEGDAGQGMSGPEAADEGVIAVVTVEFVVANADERDFSLGMDCLPRGHTRAQHSNEKGTSLRLWKNYGLSLGFCVLLFITWYARA